jgi:hypothetical protein
MTRSSGLALLAALAAFQCAQAQSVTRAAESITEADVRRRIFSIAHDSMGGRDTPSPGLDKTAQYIASEFQRFGLRPGGDHGSFLQTYPILTSRVTPGGSSIQLTGSGSSFRTTLAEGAALLSGPTSARVQGPALLVGGRLQLDSLPATRVAGRVAVYVPGPGAPASSRVLQRFARLGARAVVMVVASDSAFRNFQRAQERTRLTIGDGGVPVLVVRERSLVGQIPAAEPEFADVRAAQQMVLQETEGWNAEIALVDTTLTRHAAPNVVGILEGSDPVLRDEYLVYSAHMDHVGTTGPGSSCRPRGADSICNGADDDASGTVGVIELAEAFSRPGARPKRSVIFLTVSGEEHGLWGSGWFANNPPVPVERLVANLNLDMIGRNWKDTIVAIGKDHSDLGQTLERVNAAHPELGMTAIDDLWPAESFYTRSDHYNFAVKGVPILFFFNGVHEDYHEATDSPDRIDAEKHARITRLLFYLGQEIGNAPERPRWVEGRRPTAER